MVYALRPAMRQALARSSALADADSALGVEGAAGVSSKARPALEARAAAASSSSLHACGKLTPKESAQAREEAAVVVQDGSCADSFGLSRSNACRLSSSTVASASSAGGCPETP